MHPRWPHSYGNLFDRVVQQCPPAVSFYKLSPFWGPQKKGDIYFPTQICRWELSFCAWNSLDTTMQGWKKGLIFRSFVDVYDVNWIPMFYLWSVFSFPTVQPWFFCFSISRDPRLASCISVKRTCSVHITHEEETIHEYFITSCIILICYINARSSDALRLYC